MSKSTPQTRKAALEKLKVAFADAIWMWSQIEAELFDIAIDSFAHEARWSAEDDFRLAFFTVNGAEIRLAITHALVSKKWKRHPMFDRWSALHTEIVEARKGRNRLAHRYGTTIWDDTGEAALLLQPQRDSGFPASLGIAKGQGIDAKRLQALRAEWGRLRAKMHRFRLDAEKAQLEALIAQQAGQAHPPRIPKGRTSKARK